MLQGTLACGVHDENTLVRGASARHCAGLLTVASCDAKLRGRAMRCHGFLSLIGISALSLESRLVGLLALSHRR